MRYPLRREIIGIDRRVSILDADNKILLQSIHHDMRIYDLAAFIVSLANRWHRWRVWFRPYTREDWLWEKNIWQE